MVRFSAIKRNQLHSNGRIRRNLRRKKNHHHRPSVRPTDTRPTNQRKNKKQTIKQYHKCTVSCIENIDTCNETLLNAFHSTIKFDCGCYALAVGKSKKIRRGPMNLYVNFWKVHTADMNFDVTFSSFSSSSSSTSFLVPLFFLLFVCYHRKYDWWHFGGE